jgi:hypothetical protein
MAMEDFITELFCRIDDALQDVPKHNQANLYPSEVVTIAMLFTLKGGYGRAFYRWMSKNWRPLFPQLPHRTRLFRLEENMTELLEASTIKEFRNDPNSMVFVVASPYHWGDTDERQKLLQIQLVKEYSAWIEHFRLLFGEAFQEIYRQIDEVHKNKKRFGVRPNRFSLKPPCSIGLTIFDYPFIPPIRAISAAAQ